MRVETRHRCQDYNSGGSMAIEIGMATRVRAAEITAFTTMFLAKAESVNDDL